MLILDSNKNKIIQSNYTHILKNELRIITMFWLNCEDKNLTKPQYIDFIKNNFNNYQQIPKFYLNLISIYIRNFILDSLNPELSESYKSF